MMTNKHDECKRNKRQPDKRPSDLLRKNDWRLNDKKSSEFSSKWKRSTDREKNRFDENERWSFKR